MNEFEINETKPKKKSKLKVILIILLILAVFGCIRGKNCFRKIPS